jgi:hypothetical protein
MWSLGSMTGNLLGRDILAGRDAGVAGVRVSGLEHGKAIPTALFHALAASIPSLLEGGGSNPRALRTLSVVIPPEGWLLATSKLPAGRTKGGKQCMLSMCALTTEACAAFIWI